MPTTRSILSYGLWQQLYAGRDDAIGQVLRVGGEPHTIVGVLPADFFFVDPAVKLWRPLGFTPEERSDEQRHSNNWSMVGRLRPGATIAQAQQQVDALNARNLERFPQYREVLDQRRLPHRRRLAAGGPDQRRPQDALPPLGRRDLRAADWRA